MSNLTAACACGANTFEFKSAPIARLICHCLVCQKYTQKAYSDISIFLANQLSYCDDQATVFKRYKMPPNIRRGLCVKCHQPSIEFAALGQFVIINNANIKQPEALPSVSMHIFYHRRIHDIYDNLPKYSGFVFSQWMAAKHVFKNFRHSKH